MLLDVTFPRSVRPRCGRTWPGKMAPASGVPTLRSASGRARPTLGRRSAVSAAAFCATSADAHPGGAPVGSVVDRRFEDSTNGPSASSIVLSPRLAPAEVGPARRARRACRRRRSRSSGGRDRRGVAPTRGQRGTPQHTGGAAGLGGPCLAGRGRAPCRHRRPGRGGRGGVGGRRVPFTMPRPWSPSPATASMRPSSSSASAIMSAIAESALGDNRTAWPRRDRRRRPSATAAASAASSARRATPARRSDAGPCGRRACRPGRSSSRSSSSSSHITVSEQPAMSRLVTSSPTSGCTTV